MNILSLAEVSKIQETVQFSDFTNIGENSAIYKLSHEIPKSATYLAGAIVNVRGFRGGNRIAVLKIGDGDDSNRYGSKQIDVSEDIPKGAGFGIASGKLYHESKTNPVVKITTDKDWKSVLEGEITIILYYLE